MSLPSWERGLKSLGVALSKQITIVAPLVGAWIEMHGAEKQYPQPLLVAPLVGAWIEIFELRKLFKILESLPSWERGLKYPIV